MSLIIFRKIIYTKLSGAENTFQILLKMCALPQKHSLLIFSVRFVKSALYGDSFINDNEDPPTYDSETALKDDYASTDVDDRDIGGESYITTPD